MLFSEELYNFIDDMPVFQISYRKEILSILLGSKISRALLGCLKTPMVVFWLKTISLIDLNFSLSLFIFFFSLCDVNMFLNSFREIALQFHLQLKLFLWVIGRMLWVVKCLYKYCDKKMSIIHPVHFIPVFAANIHVTVAQLSVSQVHVFPFTSSCMGIIAFSFCATSCNRSLQLSLCRYSCSRLRRIIWKWHLHFLSISIVELKYNTSLIFIASCKILIFKITQAALLKPWSSLIFKLGPLQHALKNVQFWCIKCTDTFCLA